jgi:RNA polymerase sigma factor (sigma-70 family)
MSADVGSLVRGHLRWSETVALREVRASGGVQRCDLQDIKQGAVLGLYEAAERWDPERGAFTTWSAWCCRHAVQAERRVLRGPAPVVRRRLKADTEATHPIAAFEDADEQSFRLAQVYAEIAKWKPRDRKVFVAHHLRGMTVREIGEALGVSHQAVSERLRRLLARLRAALGLA